MSAPAAPPKAPPGPLAPPEEEFWEKYSPHYEFPLSGVGSVLMNVGALAVFLIALWLMARMTDSDLEPVKMMAMNVLPGEDASGPGKLGSGGGDPKENVDDPFPNDPKQPVPDAKLQDVKDDVKPFFPTIPNSPDAPRVEDMPNLSKLGELSDEIRKKLLEGAGGGKGSGTEPGMGPAGDPGSGNGGKGASSGQSRSLRWVIDFKTTDTTDYKNQLLACKAILAFPYPDKSLMAVKDLANPKAEAFDRSKLPNIYFVDDNNAAEMARELGLDIRPTYFIAFFPREIEEELAAKEREYRGRKESEIFSTTFSIILRDGKPSIRVTAQEAVRR